MTHAATTTRVQLARAAAIGKALAQRGWTRSREPDDVHPGAIAATAHTREGMRVLILTLGERHGQMIEITAEAATRQRGERSRPVRDTRPSWRLTAYNPLPAAILAAAAAAFKAEPDQDPLETLGWTTTHSPARKGGPRSLRMVRATRFTRPDGAVTASFHIPTYNPPCERCNHHGELGDAGGWYISGPGFSAEATAHTPAAVIGAFARALPDSSPDSPTATSEKPPDAPSRTTKPNRAATTVVGGRLTAVVP